MTTTKVVFLTVNDVYNVFPDDEGRGGIAELATLLKQVKQTIPADTKVIVTINGDFLWRTELDRKDKGAHMINMWNELEIDYAVVGNHEFDHGASTLCELLRTTKFTVFGSNVRQRKTGELLPDLMDMTLVQLTDGVVLGMFGVCTTATGNEPFAGEDVVFEDEIAHARRCVDSLKSRGASVIIALTHIRNKLDRAIARYVPGINLILGGHDHEPITVFQGNTLIHKSGMEAYWLGRIELHVKKQAQKAAQLHNNAANISTTYTWLMYANRGYLPNERVYQIAKEYTDHVAQVEEEINGPIRVLTVSTTVLDGTRITCRSAESNLGNLVADALRIELNGDAAVLNGGFIKGERLHNPGLKLTDRWLEQNLPIPNTAVVVRIKIRDFCDFFLSLLERYPLPNACHPQIAGIYVTYDIKKPETPQLKIFRDAERLQEFPMDSTIRVATLDFVLDEMQGCEFLQRGVVEINSGVVVRDIVASFLQKKAEIAYPLCENRLIIQE